MTTAEPDGVTSGAQGRVGTVLCGKYRLDRVLGIGGMAVVYKATHRNQAEFAVKMLHPELSIHEDIRTRFLREGYAANSVKHPGAVLVADDDVAEDGAAFLVMELLQGAVVESLWERMGERFPLRAVLSVADQLLDVLAAAHEKGIVHRDIKPANLFAMRDGTLKVLDFGIARVRDAAASGGKATGTGVLMGTPAFMAPEQAYARASEIDGQTDVWAVGATLFTLLSGQFVHQGENAAQLMIHAATARARPLASVVSDVPAPVAQVIDRALSFEKASRWSSAEAMRQAIERASVDAFGEQPSKSALADLVAGSDPGRLTPHLPPARLSHSPGGDTAKPAPLPVVARMTPQTQQSGPSLPRLSGGTTAQPVSDSPSLVRLAMAATNGPWKLPGVIFGAATVVALACISLFGIRPMHSATPSPRSATAAPSPPPTVSNVPAPDPVAQGVATPSDAAASPAMTKPPTTPKTNGLARGAPTAAAIAATATAKPPAPPSPPKSPTNCDPPYFIDGAGHREYKPECL
jgi:serine/threonine-protein kinase